jgi:hypothetical protein
MRAILGLLCFLSLGVAPASDDALTRAGKVAAIQTLLEEITAKREDDDAAGLPDELASAVDRWMKARDEHRA